MNALSMQSLGLGEPQTEGEAFGFNLRPDFGTDLPQLPNAKRRRPERGEAYTARDSTRPSLPYTPSNDERNLPSSVTGRPLLQLPHRDFQRSFPHTRVDYEDARVVVGPDTGPSPSGWAPAPPFSWERERALDAAMPQPWSSPEDMAMDVNGFGSLHEAFAMGAIPGMVVSLDDPPAQAATQAVAAEAAAAQAAGAGPGIVEQIISVGSTAAALYLQQQQIDAAKKTAELQQRLLAAQAVAARAPASVVKAVSGEGAGIGTYAAIGGGVLALAAAIYFATRKGGRR